MIQESINQLLTTAGIAARLSPEYGNREEAKRLAKKGLAGQKGLEDIYSSIKKVEVGKKPAYSTAELKDIEGRVGEHVSNIGALKTGAIEGMPTSKYLLKAKAGLAPREEYSDMLNKIETALGRMREKAGAAIKQDKDFSDFKESIVVDKFDDPIKKGGI